MMWLVLAALSSALMSVATAPTRIHSVESFGAVGDGHTNCTGAFRRACTAAAADRGTVLVPPGRFRTGAFNISSGVTLDVQAGAVVIGSADRHEHPLVAPLPSYGGFRHPNDFRPQSLVMIVAGPDGAPCRDVRIVGGGVIDGNGSAHW